MSEEMEEENVESELSEILQESNNSSQESENLQQDSEDIKQESINSSRESDSLPPESDSLRQNLTEDSDDAEQGTETAQDLRVYQTRLSTTEGKNDIMNMFASVWVKVEVEGEDGYFGEGGAETNSIGIKKKPSKKHKRTRKTLRCKTCDYTTVYKNCLTLHERGHEVDKPYSCDKCEYATKYPTALSRHAMIKHQAEEPNPEGKNVPIFKCDQCDYTSYFKWNLSAHKRKHKLEKQFKCQQCSYATAYRHNYIKHSKTHVEATVYQCDKCPFKTKFEGHITRHLAKIHNIVTEKAFKCDMCDFSTKTRWRLNIHRQRSRQDKVLSCVYCEFKTEFMCEFKKHKVIHYSQIYGNGKVLYNVQENDLGTTDLFNDSIDDFEPEPEKSHEIPAESKGKSQNKYLVDPDCIDWNSIQVLESEDKDRPFQCHMCNYTSRFKASVQRHFQRHHTGSQNRPYKCINCDFSTKTKDQIALHNKRSLSDVPLFCGLCKYTTNYKCQFVMHQKCHYLNKCPKCSYSCKHKYELQKHFTTVHLGNGHKCQYCDYKASRKESLLCHETIHTGNKPFRCNHCDYMSVRRSLLTNHMKRYHSDIVTDVTIISQSTIEALRQPDVPDVDANLDFSLHLS